MYVTTMWSAYVIDSPQFMSFLGRHMLPSYTQHQVKACLLLAH